MFFKILKKREDGLILEYKDYSDFYPGNTYPATNTDLENKDFFTSIPRCLVNKDLNYHTFGGKGNFNLMIPYDTYLKVFSKDSHWGSMSSAENGAPKVYALTIRQDWSHKYDELTILGKKHESNSTSLRYKGDFVKYSMTRSAEHYYKIFSSVASFTIWKGTYNSIYHPFIAYSGTEPFLLCSFWIKYLPKSEARDTFSSKIQSIIDWMNK